MPTAFGDCKNRENEALSYARYSFHRKGSSTICIWVRDTGESVRLDQHLENKRPIQYVHLRVANGIRAPAGWSAGARRSKVSPQLDPRTHTNSQGCWHQCPTSAIFLCDPHSLFYGCILHNISFNLTHIRFGRSSNGSR